MNTDKYVAFDVHSTTIFAAVHSAAGKCIIESVIETKAKTIRDFLKGISGKIHITFKQGTQSSWLYDLVKPLVASHRLQSPAQQTGFRIRK
jgi:hypothetical protein